ncbi:MAG TPA: hypothetical protein VJ867_01435 [Gemmatimonadaceae bacterium]|nr:hypothetical protein [Gemmatimonadaceae bacterium]
MGQRRERDLGPHQHAEGRPGDKTHARFVEQLAESSAPDTADAPADRSAEATGASTDGHHRLREGREQHDEAEKNSEHVTRQAHIPHEGDSH